MIRGRARRLTLGATLGTMLALGAGAARALELVLPEGAVVTADLGSALDSHPLPIGPYAEDSVPMLEAEGVLRQTAWRIRGTGATTLQLLQPLREQIQAAGYQTLYSCDTVACGGFDFRYATALLPEPDMHVDLGDFRYLAARKETPEGPAFVSLWVSRSSDSGFVHLTQIAPPDSAAAPSLPPDPGGTDPLDGPATGPAPPLDAPPAQPPAQPPAGVPAEGAPGQPSGPVEGPTDGLAAELVARGAVALDDLLFATGAAALEPGSFDSLAALGDWLAADPARHLMLVGHSDAEGGLAGNVALSKRRAQSVADRLLALPGVAPDQVTAEGAGYLAPRAPNTTPEGRARNRRVEAILLP